MTFGVCDFSRLAFMDWSLRRWRLCSLALMTATRKKRPLPPLQPPEHPCVAVAHLSSEFDR